MNVKPASRLSYAPILLGVAFIATLFMVAESGYKRIHEAGLAISAAEERQALLSRYLRLVLDAETAQRGFLLTEDPEYLRSFDPAVRALDPMLDPVRPVAPVGVEVALPPPLRVRAHRRQLVREDVDLGVREVAEPSSVVSVQVGRD